MKSPDNYQVPVPRISPFGNNDGKIQGKQYNKPVVNLQQAPVDADVDFDQILNQDSKLL